MRRNISLILCLLISTIAFSQYTVRFEVTGYYDIKDFKSSSEPLYIAASFNSWNPGTKDFKMVYKPTGVAYVETYLPKGDYEYKVTRGSWDKVECGSDGHQIENRRVTITSDTVIAITINGWSDSFLKKDKKSTASKNVYIMSNNFRIKELNTTRRIWIYFPPDYTTTQKRYPVLYMHDGQNVFEDSTSFSGEWGVDEFMDTIRNNCIVVAIDHGGPKRINEYCPYDMEKFGKGEGKQYVDFLATALKPYIDKKYRTLKKKEYTFVAGSSMGGLISMYAILQYPKVFGGAGVFSPAFWVGPKIFDDITSRGEKVKGRIYFYGGKQESERMVPDMLKAFEKMRAVSKADMTTVIRDDGKHNEPTWRREFPRFFEWMMRR
jgi:predicted alpha/beta superfamily hydrolase